MALDPETVLGFKLATAKTAAAGTLFGVLRATRSACTCMNSCSER